MFERWFESWTDVVTGMAAVAAVAYVAYEINRQQRKLRDLFYVLGDDDMALHVGLEELVRRGLLSPQGGAATA